MYECFFDTYNSGRAGSMSFDETMPALFVLGPGALPEKLGYFFDVHAPSTDDDTDPKEDFLISSDTIRRMLKTLFAAAKVFVTPPLHIFFVW